MFVGGSTRPLHPEFEQPGNPAVTMRRTQVHGLPLPAFDRSHTYLVYHKQTDCPMWQRQYRRNVRQGRHAKTCFLAVVVDINHEPLRTRRLLCETFRHSLSKRADIPSHQDHCAFPPGNLLFLIGVSRNGLWALSEHCFGWSLIRITRTTLA